MWTQIEPMVYELLAAVLSVLVSAALVAVTSYIKQKANNDDAESLIFLLHHALETGVKAAENAQPGATAATIVNEAIAHAMESIPETIAKLNPAMQVLINIAMSKLTPKAS